jgi:hypothetical protein
MRLITSIALLFAVLIMVGMFFMHVASDNILDEGDENFYNDGVNYNK